MSAPGNPKPIKRGRINRIVGLIAIALIVMLTILATAGILSLVEWIIAEIIVALAANIIFRTINKRSSQ